MFKPFRRFVRFRLSTLLIAVTLLSIWLAMESARARNQSRVAAMLKRAGATAWFERRLRGDIEVFEYVAEPAAGGQLPVNSGTAPGWRTDTFVEHFLSRLVIVFVHITQDKNAMIQGLLASSSLYRLDVSGISDDDLVEFHRLRELTDLTLSDPEITDASVTHLAKLTKLRDLNLTGTSITPAGFSKLQHHLPRCLILGDPNSKVEILPAALPVRTR